MQLNAEMAQLLHEGNQMEVQDYPLKDAEGNPTRLSEVFGEHDKLVLVHNMGKSCPYCTMWADGLNGLYHYVEKGFDGTAARFILVNNDEPEEIKKFANSRGWNFDCYSCRGTSLFMDL
ncbi:MAG TPA: redoxin domain-containing protein, partial [Firmicutes bacterium]|nr:redoxin domain-containing protein [Bacillota bacterium]